MSEKKATKAPPKSKHPRVRKHRWTVMLDPEWVERIKALSDPDEPLAIISRRVIRAGLEALEAQHAG